MRIIIETTGQGEVSVAQEGQAPSLAASLEEAEVMDGGGAPQELVELLSGEAPEEGVDLEPSPVESGDVENAGAAPAWLVEVIEGSPQASAMEPRES